MCTHVGGSIYLARMNLLPAREAFHEAVRRLQLPRSSTVVVGLSGGPDSVALTFLARQVFSRVVAVTVDHRLRKESAEEAQRAGCLARDLGVDHVITGLEWGRGVSKTAHRARCMRYSVLTRECERLEAGMLMVGHHSNDQIETMLCRLMMGSGLVGLGGMLPTTYWAAHPTLPIVRPLLNCHKSSLMELCREEGLEWTQDPSNQKPISPRNRIRPILARHPELGEGLSEIVSLCQETREISQPQTSDLVKKLATINSKYGTLSFDSRNYRSLNPYIARSVLAIWLRFVSSSGNSINRYGLQKLHNLVILDKTVTDTNSNCVLIPLPKEGQFMIAKQKPPTGRSGRTLIRVGETILWDNRFRISLFEKTSGKKKRKGDVNSRVFYVRNFLRSDHMYVVKGVRKVRRTVLVHYHVRGGLPVVVDETGTVVLIPHFRVMDHSVGVDCKVTFEPQWSIDELLNFHYIVEDPS